MPNPTRSLADAPQKEDPSKAKRRRSRRARVRLPEGGVWVWMGAHGRGTADSSSGCGQTAARKSVVRKQLKSHSGRKRRAPWPPFDPLLFWNSAAEVTVGRKTIAEALGERKGRPSDRAGASDPAGAAGRQMAAGGLAGGWRRSCGQAPPPFAGLHISSHLVYETFSYTRRGNGLPGEKISRPNACGFERKYLSFGRKTAHQPTELVVW